MRRHSPRISPHSRVGCRPVERILCKAWLAARRRLPVRQWLPGRPVYPAGVGVLSPVWQQAYVCRTELGPGPSIWSCRTLRLHATKSHLAVWMSATCFTLGTRVLSSSWRAQTIASVARRQATPATVRLLCSATRMPTVGCCRKSQRVCPVVLRAKRPTPRQPIFRRHCCAPQWRTGTELGNPIRNGPIGMPSTWSANNLVKRYRDKRARAIKIQ
jgi:hypothetical protein